MTNISTIRFLNFSILLMGVLLFAPLALLAQQNTPLSSTPDTVRLQQLDSLVQDVFWRKQADSSFHYLEEMRQLARRVNNREYIRLCWRLQAKLSRSLGNYYEAVDATRERIAASQAGFEDTTKQYRSLSSAHRNLAIALRKTGQSEEALEQYERSIHYAESIGKDGEDRLANALNSLGNFYNNLREYELAKEKYEASLVLHEALEKKQGIYSNLNNLGLIEARMGNYEEAITYYQRSLAMKEKAGDEKRMANTLGSIGDIYLVWGREEQARQYFLRAKALQEKLGLRDELTRSFTQLGDLANLQGKPEEALQWCNQSRAIAEEDQLWQASMACHQCLYKAYEALGRSSEALQAFKAYTTVKDSVLSLENKRQIAEMEMKWDYERELQTAEREQLELVAEAEQNRLQRRSFIGLIIALALLSGLALFTARSRQKQNQLLSQQNEKIAQDNVLIQQQAEALRQSAQQKEQFYTDISHELLTPLTLVSSPLEQMIKQSGEQLPDHVKNTLASVRNNASKLRQLVEELLELARLEAGTVQVQPSPVDIESFLKTSLEQVELLANQKDITVHQAQNLPAELIVQTDRRRLSKVVDNLLANALKFTPTGGEVSLVTSWEEAKNQLIITVQDTGPGIPPEQLPQIFDRYYRGKLPNGGEEEGTGIGLALAQESARLLGGEITVASTVGQGSNFQLVIPNLTLVTDVIKTVEQPTPFVPLNDVQTHRILLVEDHPELRDYIGQLLDQYACTKVNNGQAALTQLLAAYQAKQPFSLVITDLMMPVMDGTRLIQEIKSNSAINSTPIIVLSARQAESTRLEHLRFGIDDYLTKPFSGEELQLRVANLLRYRTAAVEQVETEVVVDKSNWLGTLERTVETMLGAQQEVSATSLASIMALSNRQLLRKIKASTGLSTQQYLQECKLQLAQRYLLEGRFTTVTEVAQACGFSSGSYLTRIYEERFGRRPGDYLTADSG